MDGARGWRWLLIGVALVQVVLVVRDLRRGDAGRYVVTPLRAGSPVLVRTDTATGESWRLELRAGGEAWVPIAGPGEAPPGDAELAQIETPAGSAPRPRALARDEIRALANAILGDELAPDIRMWAVGQLAATPDRRATLALIQLLEVIDEPPLVALIRAALEQRGDDPRARDALERLAQKTPPSGG
jgi:hypothetical protein